LVDLVQQHANAHGVTVEGAALDRVMAATSGQPWQTCKILQLACFARVSEEAEAVTPVTSLHVERAISTLLKSRTTHVDSLSCFYRRDHRIRGVYEYIASGGAVELPWGSLELASELGLVTVDGEGVVRWTSEIVEDVMARCWAEVRFGENPGRVFSAIRSRCFAPGRAPDWVQLVRLAVEHGVVPDVGRSWDPHVMVFGLPVREGAFFQHRMHAVLSAVVNSHGHCVRELRSMCDEFVTLWGPPTASAVLEYMLVKPEDGGGLVGEEALHSAMTEAVDQIDDAFGVLPTATAGVAVVFALSAGELRKRARVVEVPADDATHPLEPRPDGRTIHRLIVRIRTEARPRPAKAGGGEGVQPGGSGAGSKRAREEGGERGEGGEDEHTGRRLASATRAAKRRG
jgi:hypothetical protein